MPGSVLFHPNRGLKSIKCTSASVTVKVCDEPDTPSCRWKHPLELQMCIDPLLKIVPNKFIIFPLIEVGGLLEMAALSSSVDIFKKKK